MASVSLITMNAPSGFWPAILNFFKGANGTYILAVILVAIVVRFLFSFVDIINKRANMKNSAITEKMQPEIDALQKKYGNDKNVLQQKTNDVYKKYQYNMMGSCLPMLIVMVLQLVVFLTLWSSLQSVANFNIASQYQEMKEIYANVLTLNEESLISSNFVDGDSLVVEVVEENGEKFVSYQIVNGSVEGQIRLEGKVSWTENLSNEAIVTLIETYVVTETSDGGEVQAEEEQKVQTALEVAIRTAAESAASEYYVGSLESFLWIKNVYESDTSTSPLFSEDDVISLMASYYDETDGGDSAEDYERMIYNCVVAGVDVDELGSNGYYILPILAMLSSLLSIWLNNFLTRRKGQTKQKQSWAMYVIMPVIYAIFTFMYTSLFSIYLIIGQLMMVVTAPITTLIVRKWLEHDEKKKKEKDVVVVDYRRKD